MKLSLVLPALLATAGLASAQTVTFRGKVEDVSGTIGQFFVDCTNVSLSSASINLNPFVGQQTLITGQWNGSVAAPAVVVTSISTVAESFEIGGGGKIGDVAKPSVTGAPGSLGFTFGALSTSFLPAAGLGVVFLGPNFFATGSGTIPGGGTLELSIPIPNDPSLIGVDIFGQGIIVNPASGSAFITNPDCKTLES